MENNFGHCFVCKKNECKYSCSQCGLFYCGEACQLSDWQTNNHIIMCSLIGSKKRKREEEEEGETRLEEFARKQKNAFFEMLRSLDIKDIISVCDSSPFIFHTVRDNKLIVDPLSGKKKSYLEIIADRVAIKSIVMLGENIESEEFSKWWREKYKARVAWFTFYYDTIATVKSIKWMLADPLIDPTFEENGAFFSWVATDNAEAVQTIIRYVDPSGYDNKAIKLAMQKDNVDVVRVLLEDERVDPSGTFGIMFAAKEDQPEILKLLLKDGRIDPSEDKNRALEIAIQMDHPRIVELLLADPRVVPNQEHLVMARDYVDMFGRDPTIVNLLINYGRGQ